jgi:hypothetical protein
MRVFKMELKGRKIQVKVEVRKVPKIGALVAGHLFSLFTVIRPSYCLWESQALSARCIAHAHSNVTLLHLWL